MKLVHRLLKSSPIYGSKLSYQSSNFSKEQLNNIINNYYNYYLYYTKLNNTYAAIRCKQYYLKAIKLIKDTQ